MVANEETSALQHAVVWGRHDFPGHEACRVVEVDTGWRLEGVAVLCYEGLPCRLDYFVECDPRWATRSAGVSGWVGDRTIGVLVAREATGQWRLNGSVCGEVDGCVDVDLHFSPSTNLLPIRRLDLAIGAAARVRAAWLVFPSFALEPLDQIYTRLEARRFRYEAAGGFTVEVAVDDAGLVIDYGRIWSREADASSCERQATG